MASLRSRLGRDGIAGVAVALLGLVGFAIVYDYPIGSLSEFGPGFMPWVATIGMTALGAAMAMRALLGVRLADAAPVAIVVGRPLFLVPLGMAVFALGLDPLGFALASALAVFVTGLASRESSLAERVLTSVVLAGLVTLIFGYGLSMTMPLWPAFLRS